MKKHAYLILAHADFEILQRLVSALDDPRHDIYIHIDKKVRVHPDFFTTYSKLHIVENRIDVRWGDLSMIEAEYRLLEYAISGYENYVRYHIISGTHFPIQPLNKIYDYFSETDQNLFMRMDTSEKEIELKLNRYNFFVRNFNHKNESIKRFVQFCWHAVIKFQQLLRVKRQDLKQAVKASQWLSLNHSAVKHLLTTKKKIVNRYRWTLCGDEFFIPSTLLSDMPNSNIAYVENSLFTEFDGPNPKIITEADLSNVINSQFLFARKFNDQHVDCVDQISSILKENNA